MINVADDNRSPLPANWIGVRLSDIAVFVRGVTYEKKDASLQARSDLVPLVRAHNISGTLNSDDLVYVPHSVVGKDQYIEKGDIVICTSSGSKTLVGKAAQAETNLTMAFGAFCGVVRPASNEVARYIGYYFQTAQYRRYMSTRSKGIGINNLKREHFEELVIPLPPVQEAVRIVTKIDELFTDIDEGERCLARAEALLKQYRQSVLKAAVTGELTRDWRAKNASKAETGADFLDRILVARREAWQKTGRRTNYVEPASPDLSNLSKLPRGWVWATLETVAAISGGITVDKKREEPDFEQVPYLRVANVQRGWLDLSEIKTIRAPKSKIDTLLLTPGDILFNEGGDRDKIGRGWVWRGELPRCIHQNHVFRARLYRSEISPEFFSFFANEMGRGFFMTEGKQTTNLASISLTKISKLPVPVPPVDEAREIIDRCARLLTISDKIGNEIASGRRDVAILRQSILRAAFSGKLVAQDANDEPVAVLLHRIAERSRVREAATKSMKVRKHAPA